MQPPQSVGRVWTKDELTRLGEICFHHGVIVAADEIHQDFVYPGFTHHMFASLKPEFQKFAITLTAPTKTFNLAGLQISNILIADMKLKHLFTDEMAASGYSQPNVMGIAACKAAYSQGEPWFNELLSYLHGNLRRLDTFVNDKLPGVRLIMPEGTYLYWLDMHGLSIDVEEVNRLIVHKARLWLDDGRMFGTGGEGFQRINIACPRIMLEKALEQLAAAF